MRHRNKLLFVFLVFLFAALFVGSVVARTRGYRHAGALSIIGQVGLALSILLYFVVPDSSGKKEK